jgi:polyisoprenoid-binding protein YceI
METATTVRTKWAIDPAHSEFSFKVKHLMITNVKGVFRDVDADIYTRGDDFLTSEINVRIKTASIDTGDEKRNAHLKSPDFFDAENHKELFFVGKKFQATDEPNKYVLYGELTIKGVTVPVKLDVEYNGLAKDPWGKQKAGFSIDGKINRKDWELNWNTTLETGGVLVGDEVRINCEVQLVKES